MLRKALRILAQYGPTSAPVEPNRDAAPGACMFCGTKCMQGEKKCSKCGKEITADTDTNIFWGQPLSENLLENKPVWSKKMKKNAEKWKVTLVPDATGMQQSYGTFESEPAARAHVLDEMDGSLINEFEDGGSEWNANGGHAFIERAGHTKKAAANSVTPEQIIETFETDEATAKQIVDILNAVEEDRYEHMSHTVSKALMEVDHLLKGFHYATFGVEGVEGEYSDSWMLYLNTGDTYASTIVYDEEDGFYMGSWGDWVEEEDKYRYEEEMVLAKQNIESMLNDVLSGYEGYVFIGPEDDIGAEHMGADYWQYLWDAYVSEGKADTVMDIIEDKEKALEFLVDSGQIRKLTEEEAKELDIQDDIAYQERTK